MRTGEGTPWSTQAYRNNEGSHQNGRWNDDCFRLDRSAEGGSRGNYLFCSSAIYRHRHPFITEYGEVLVEILVSERMLALRAVHIRLRFEFVLSLGDCEITAKNKVKKRTIDEQGEDKE